MSEAKNTKLMDTEPGGENTQYESVHEFTKPHAKSSGQFSDPSTNEASQQKQQEKDARGEKTAENIRYGEAISEHGFGGETVGNNGQAKEGGYGRVQDDQEGDVGLKNTRREQGYGVGSGVGG